MSPASARECLREVFVATTGSPRRSRSRNRIEPPLDTVDVHAGVRLVVLHDLALPRTPSTGATLNRRTRTRFPSLIENSYRSSERTGGPALRLPSES